MKKILVIDDDQEFVTELNEILHDEGYQVFTANGGESGLALFIESNPDLVLLDMKLPVLTGAQILPIMKGKRKDIPILMISGKPAKKELSALGADGYISKPFDIEFALKTIHTVLD